MTGVTYEKSLGRNDITVHLAAYNVDECTQFKPKKFLT